MERWTGAFGKVRVRQFSDLVTKVESALVFNFAADASSVKEFADAAWSADQPSDLVVSMAGRNDHYAKCFLTAYSKFQHVLDCARTSFERGALTWGLVDSYHASLLGARSIASALGIHIYNLAGRTVLIDLFPDLGPKDHQKKFFKEHKDLIDPVRIMAPTKDKILDQSKIWQLVTRLFDLKSFSSSEEEAIQLALKELLKSKPWAERHDVLYDLASWRWPEDIGLAPKSSKELDELLIATDSEVAELSQFVDKIFELNAYYFSELEKRVSGLSLDLPPSVSSARLPVVMSTS